MALFELAIDKLNSLARTGAMCMLPATPLNILAERLSGPVVSSPCSRPITAVLQCMQNSSLGQVAESVTNDSECSSRCSKGKEESKDSIAVAMKESVYCISFLFIISYRLCIEGICVELATSILGFYC